MITQEQVEQIIREKIEGTEIFLVAVIMNPGNNIHVHLDTQKGISIDECVEVSRYIVSKMDKDIEDYNLEVSSPGLDSPFRVKEQYEKNLGKEVEIVKTDGSKIKGRLLTYSGDKIEVEHMVKPKSTDKSKKPTAQQATLILDDIKTIKSVISFK
ncbi:MAG: ribosome assembly cofactor RimP [Bacteroidales bacterium]|nr:ribosome assembly cofactor RimP [Bacteroidales bacterium]